MPFLGKQPTAGFASIVKDDFTPNGSTTAFTLSKQVANANDIAVFLGNVRQEPTDAYTVNGTTLTMSEAPASGLNFYVLHIAGTVESSVVPADNTISTAKILNNAVTDGKIAGMAASKLTGAFDSSHAFDSSQVFPAGHVIQTVIGTSTSTVSTTSGSPQDLLSVSITPKFTTSTIILEGYISRFDIAYNGNAYGSVYLINPAGSGITTGVAGDAGHNNANIVSVFGSHSPNSTSSQTYKLAMSTASGSTTSVNTDGQRYSLVLKEIAQ